MKTRFHLLLGLGLFMGLAPQAMAVPVKFPKCAGDVRLRHAPGGSGAYLSDDCKILYVLPPQKGQLTVNGYIPGSNLDLQCSRLRTIEESQLKQDEFRKIYSERLQQYAEQIQNLQDDLKHGLSPVGKSKADVEREIDDLVNKISDLRQKMAQWTQQDDDEKFKVAQIEGGRGKFMMQNTYTDLLNEYRRLNPGLSVQKMTLDQSFISVNEQVPSESDKTRMPAIIKLANVGIGDIPRLLDPALLVKYKDLAPHTAPGSSKIFSDALSGEIQLSTVGACAVRQALGGQTQFPSSAIKDYVASTASYSYQLQVHRRHSMKYNIRELVRQIHEQVTHGGFFSSSTVDSFIDNRQSSAWMKFEVQSQDTRYEYTDEYIREVKKEFIDRALAQIIAIQTGSQSATLALIAPGRNGADQMGDALQKCPHLYCQIGSQALSVLNAVFGSSSATTDLLKTLDGERSETVDEYKMVPEYGTYIFE